MFVTNNRGLNFFFLFYFYSNLYNPWSCELFTLRQIYLIIVVFLHQIDSFEAFESWCKFKKCYQLKNFYRLSEKCEIFEI